MPAQFDASAVSTPSSTGSTGTTLNLTIAANANRRLVVDVVASQDSGTGAADTSTDATSVTWTPSSTGVPEALARQASATGNSGRTAVWNLIAPTAGAGVVTVTMPGATLLLSACARSYFDADQTVPPLGTPTPYNQGRGFGTAPAFIWGAGSGIGSDDLAHFATYIDQSGGSPVTFSASDIPQYVNVGTAVQSNGATSLSPTSAPAELMLGDWEFAAVATENNNTIGVSGSGWAQVGSTVAQDATWQTALFARRYDGSNVNPTFSWSGSVGCSARRFAYRNALSTGTHTTNSGTSSTHTINGINATAANSVVAYIDHAEANTRLGSDASYSERFDAGSATGPYNIALGDRLEATGGAGSDNFSATGAAASWVLRLLELLALPQAQVIREFTTAAVPSLVWFSQIYGERAGNASGVTQLQFAMIGDTPFEIIGLTTPIKGATAPSGVTASANIADGDDSLAATGILKLQAGAAIADGADVLSGSAAARVSGSSSTTDGDDAMSTGGKAIAAASGTLTDGADGLAAAGSGRIAGSGTLTDAGDILSAEAGARVAASGSPADADDVLAGTGTSPAHVSASSVDGDDLLAATGAARVTAAAAITDSDDGLSAHVGLGQAVASFDVVDEPDGLAAAAIVRIAGGAVLGEAGDGFAASGAATVSATGAIDDDPDALSADGHVRISATASLVDEDGLAADGSAVVTGSLEALDEADDLSASASLGNTITGSAEIIDADDVLAATATRSFVSIRIVTRIEDDPISCRIDQSLAMRGRIEDDTVICRVA